MSLDDSSAPAASEGRAPAVLQILPSLVSGGAERGAVDLAGALAAAGWASYVASAGGPLEHEVARSGATHLTLPLASKNPLAIRRNGARPGAADPPSRDRHRACPQPRPGVERMVGGRGHRPPLRDHLPQRL